MLEIVRLYLSRGHNYFGHHEQPPGDHANVEVDQLECVAGRGVRGDPIRRDVGTGAPGRRREAQKDGADQWN